MRNILLPLIILFVTSSAEAQEVCRYADNNGEIKIAEKQDVPARYRKDAQCVEQSGSRYMAAPDQIDLSGSVRREDMSTPLGRIQLRWPRNIEGLFGRTPNRAVQEAARAVSRVLRQAAFPAELQRSDTVWNVVFLDTREPATQAQIPTYLVHNCHPGWMTPPANVYIVAQRVAGDCSINKTDSGANRTSGVADAELAEVLVHEFGHVVEYKMLQGSRVLQSKLQAEGFATWFEHLSAEQSPILNAREMNSKRLEMAKMSYRASPNGFNFSRGDGLDYSRASFYFTAIQDRFGISGITDLYQTMKSENVDLFGAAERRFKWNREQFEAEVSRLLK